MLYEENQSTPWFLCIMYNVGKGEEGVCTIGIPNKAPVTSINSTRAAATQIGGQAVNLRRLLIFKCLQLTTPNFNVDVE